MSPYTAARIGDYFGVGAEYLMFGKLDRRENLVGEKMAQWLWQHPEEREEIWREMEGE